MIATASVAGVRRALTLAGVLTLPIAMNDGSPFPARDLAILLAAGVIFVSLVIASLIMPSLLKGLTLPAEESDQAEEDHVRIQAAEAAIRAVECVQRDLAKDHRNADIYSDVGARVIDLYRRRIDGRSQTGESVNLVRKTNEIERELLLAALKAERDEIFHLARTREVDHDLARRLVREIDLLDVRYRT